MKVTDKNMVFVLFFVPFMFTHCFAEWGSHGQRMRSPEYMNDNSDTLIVDTSAKRLEDISDSCNDLDLGIPTDPAIGKSVADNAAPEYKGDSASGGDKLEGNPGILKLPVYSASIIDYYGYVVPEEATPLAKIKRFRGTVEPGGDTIHFRIPVYGEISLENLEFSGVEYKDPEIFVETRELENPYSFSSGLWTAILSLGGIFSSVAFTEPALAEKTYSGEMITLMVCGYMASGVGQYFGVDKMVRHFRWKNQFGNRSSHN